MMSNRKARIQPFALAPAGEREWSNQSRAAHHRAHSIVLTRYFVKLFAPAKARELTEKDILKWFESRQSLFEKYTLPSINAQALTRKTWLIYVEKGYRKLLPAQLLDNSHPDFIEIVEIDSTQESFESFGSIVRRSIDQQLAAMHGEGISDAVVTVTRIDNDDALAIDYLETLAKLATTPAARQLASALVTFPHGLQCHDQGPVGTYIFNNNHFLSSFHYEPTSILNTEHAFSFNHGQVFARDKPPLIVNTDLPMWVEVIHSNNISNRFRSELRLLATPSLESRFACKFDGNISSTQSGGDDAGDTGIILHPSQARMRAAQAIGKAMKPDSFLMAYSKFLPTSGVQSMLEIGVHEGGSLKFWRELYGSEFRLYGLDIKQECSRFAPSLANEIFIGSQTDQQLLDKVAKAFGPFDIIVDDGSHRNEHMWDTLAFLFKSISPGGIYVVEDVFTSYWERYGGGLKKSDSFIERSKSRIDEIFVTYLGAKYSKHHSIRSADVPIPTALSVMIDSISFYRCGLAVFRKIDLPIANVAT